MKFRQKPKPYIEAVALSLVPKFTKLCCLEKQPIVTFSRRNVRDIVRGRKRNMSSTKYMGTAYKKENLIWLNPNHDSADGIRDTLAHEFCHFRFPSEGHTQYFYQKVKELLAGRQFKPLRKR